MRALHHTHHHVPWIYVLSVCKCSHLPFSQGLWHPRFPSTRCSSAPHRSSKSRNVSNTPASAHLEQHQAQPVLSRLWGQRPDDEEHSNRYPRDINSGAGFGGWRLL